MIYILGMLIFTQDVFAISSLFQHQVCEPPVRRVPLSLQAEYWTFKPKITVIGADGSSSEDLSGVDGGTEQVLGSSVELHLEAEAYIDSSYTFKLLGQQARPVCDTGNFVIVNGECMVSLVCDTANFIIINGECMVSLVCDTANFIIINGECMVSTV